MQILELERRAAAQEGVTRGSAVSSWADEELAPDKMYFVDSHGDQNNLVYSGLYRGDVAAYYRLDPNGFAKGATQHHGRQRQRSALLHQFPVNRPHSDRFPHCPMHAIYSSGLANGVTQHYGMRWQR